MYISIAVGGQSLRTWKAMYALHVMYRELRDVVFEDVGFEHDILIDPQQLKVRGLRS